MSTSAESVPVGSKGPARAAPRRGIPFGYIVMGLVAVGIGVLIVATASGGRYELEVGQVALAPDRFDEKDVRVRGQIKDGSVVATMEDGKPLTRFTLVDGNGHELPIVSRESPPDNFEGGKSCIVEGRFTKQSGAVESTRLTMKCPSKYEAEGNTPRTTEELQKEYGSPAQGGPGI